MGTKNARKGQKVTVVLVGALAFANLLGVNSKLVTTSAVNAATIASNPATSSAIIMADQFPNKSEEKNLLFVFSDDERAESEKLAEQLEEMDFSVENYRKIQELEEKLEKALLEEQIEREISADAFCEAYNGAMEMISSEIEARRAEAERQEAERLARIEAKKRAARKRARRIAREKAERKAARQAKRQQARQFADTADEEGLLAKVIDLEAGNSNYKDMVGVGSVVLNRVRTNYKSFRYTNSISAVVYADGQYGCLDDIPDCIPSQTAREIAHGLLTGEIQCWPEYVLYQTTYRQSWMDGYVVTYDLGNDWEGEYYGIPKELEAKYEKDKKEGKVPY